MNNIEIPNNSNVSLYSDVQDTEGRVVSLSEVMDGIKNGEWKEQIANLRSIRDEKAQKSVKNNLPCFTGSGVFEKRTTEGLLTHSDALIIDIDSKENPILSQKFDEIRQKLIADKYTFFLFTSCRGNGLAVGVRIDGAEHLEAFPFLAQYYKERYGLVIDKGCKDVTRLRFISYDPDLYLSEGAQIVIVPPEFMKEPKCSHAPVFYANGKNHEIIKAIIASGKILGNDSYNDWLKIGFALSHEFGEAGRAYFHELSKISPKYDPVDCDRKFNNCLRNNRGDVTFGTIVHLAKEAGIVFKNASLWTPITEVTEVTDDPESKIEIPDFPINVFPTWLKDFILDLSNSIGVPASTTASIVLTIVSSAVGNTIRTSPKPNFEVSPFLWTTNVMPTGSGKSPLLEQLTKIVKKMQALSYRQFKDKLRVYKNEVRNFRKGEGCELPDEPIFEQFLIQDTTLEALGNAYEGQPRGLLSVQDELSGWLLGMNQYKKAGNDRQLYLELFNSSSWAINRKIGVKFIPATGLGIIGNIQPEMIPKIFENESFADGLIQRILFVYPGATPMKFRREAIADLTMWNELIGWCYQLPLKIDENGFTVPKVLRLEGGALDAYEAFYNEYGCLAEVLPVRYRGFISKLFLYCLKFAGILHVAEGFKNEAFSNTIPEKTITNAVALTKFYFGQISLILRLYKKGTKPFTELQEKVIQILHKLQGEVENGMLRLEKIVDCYNDGLPEKFQLTPERVSNILNNEIGLATQKSTGNHSYLIWEDEKLKKLFKQTVTTVTTVTQKAEKQEMAVTEVTVVTDESEENLEEIPEVEYVEVKANV